MMPETEALYDYCEPWPKEGSKNSCTVVIDKAVLFLGGYYEQRQISQLTPLGLIRIGTLPFNNYIQGTCLVMDTHLFLGFNYPLSRRCFSR